MGSSWFDLSVIHTPYMMSWPHKGSKWDALGEQVHSNLFQ